LASKAIEFDEKCKIKAITQFNVIQGHRLRYQLKAGIRLSLINSNWHHISRTVSELSQLIVQILDTSRFRAPPPAFGEFRDKVRCSSCVQQGGDSLRLGTKGSYDSCVGGR